MDIAAGVLIGNLFAAASLYGLHIATAHDRQPGQSWFGGGLAFVPAFLIFINAVGETDALRTTAAAAFVAAIVTVAFLWGARTVVQHEKTSEFSVKAWAAVLVPVIASVVWLWSYAPIG